MKSCGVDVVHWKVVVLRKHSVLTFCQDIVHPSRQPQGIRDGRGGIASCMHCTLTALRLQFACNGGRCNLLPKFLLHIKLPWDPKQYKIRMNRPFTIIISDKDYCEPPIGSSKNLSSRYVLHLSKWSWSLIVLKSISLLQYLHRLREFLYKMLIMNIKTFSTTEFFDLKPS